MSISHYIKEIGRGQRGARPLSREAAADLFGQVLDGQASDLEIGAFCLAMRLKGETPLEMAGFLDATHARLARFPATRHPLVVIPSYNGARKLPVLTPLLALLVARRGLPVLVHGCQTEARRISAQSVLEALDILPLAGVRPIAEGEVAYASTELLCPGLRRLLDVRQVVGLRNSGHSVVKLMQPCAGNQLVISSYTHSAYALSMRETFALLEMSGLLSRGLEGESVTDPRRTAEIEGFVHGKCLSFQTQAPGTSNEVPGLPATLDTPTTADYTRRILTGTETVPEAIAQQVAYIEALARQLSAPRHL